MNPTDGDRRAFDKLVREYAQALYRFSYRLTADRESAEDLVQETYEQAWRGLSGLLRADSPRAWLFRILRRRYGRWLKRRSRDRELRSRNPLSSEDPWQSANDQQALVACELHVVETRDEIQSALGELEERFKQPLLLVFMEGLSVAETARVLGIRRGTVLSRLHRGRQKMKRMLETDAHPRGAKRKPTQQTPADKPPVLLRYKRA